ncbi:ATP-dependent helicase [Microbacterium halophytorum]|uniref:ATP-dependent helicase n=1 Tax=Microbacterium halophytorum TaxID=2067568 RepID=UPI000CFE2A33|nr:ATP-dependent DNA helicase [Microbacterium halophytorum]
MDSFQPTPEQLAVIDLPAGASGTVIGAPGTGKTAALVERAAGLLAGGTAPGELVVLTPTRASATRLRDRLGVRVGVATPGPLARSVGSLAFQIVRADAVRRGEASPQLLTGADQDRIIAEILAGDEEDELEGRGRWPASLGTLVRRSPTFRAELRAFLSDLTERGVEPEVLASLGDDAWAAVAEFVRDYRTVLAGMRDAHRDSSELYRDAASALADEAAGGLGEIDGLRVVLIDDAQELTAGGVALVEALRVRGVAVVAFGDPDIGSGAFRGAAPELFARLAASLGEVFVLGDGHRSHPAIARLARVVTAQIGAGGRVEHRSAPGPEVDGAGVVGRIVAASPYEEADRIAWELRSWHLDGGTPWRSMAVVAHDTRQIVALEAELAAREVPTRAAGVQRPLGGERAVRELVELVRLGLLAPGERDADALVAALRSPYGGFDGVALRRLRARMRHRELADGGTTSARELLASALAAPELFDFIDTPEARSAKRFGQTLARLREMGDEGATIHELLWEAWDRARTPTGRRLDDAWRELASSSRPLAAETSRALDGLVALFAAAKRYVERSPGEGPAGFIHNILDSDVPEDSLSAPDRGGAVTLLTPASALGLEFDAVVVAGLQDGVWPNVRLRGGMLEAWRLPAALEVAVGDQPEAAGAIDRRRAVLHDELRLFVRAITRARSRLLLTAVGDDDQAPSPLLDLVPDAGGDAEFAAAREHPLTLRGLVAAHRRTLTTSRDGAERAAAAGQLAVLAREGVPGAAPADWYGTAAPTSDAPLIDPSQRPVRVSPSRMQTFEDCGLDWAIRVLGGDTDKSASTGIGTILHAALEASPTGDIDAMRRVVDERWGELEFEAAWIEKQSREQVERSLQNLHRYASAAATDGGRVLATEADFQVVVPFDPEPGDAGADGEAERPRVIGVPEGARRPEELGPIALIRGTIDRVESYPLGHGDHGGARGRTWDPIAPRNASAAEQVVIADLKTGRYEARLGDPKVVDDAQLSAYQLAVEAGLVPGAEPGALAGARLVVVSKATGAAAYRVAHQPAFEPEQRDAFLRRVVEAARGMSAAAFTANVEAHCNGSHRPTLCRPHTVKAVSAS